MVELKGKYVELGSLNHEHLPKLQEWRNQPDMMAINRTWQVLSSWHQQWFWEHIIKSDKHLVFGIYHVKDIYEKELIGVCRVSYIDWQARTGEIGIYIGDEDSRSKGFGADALRVMCNFAFAQAGIVRLEAQIRIDNEPSKRLFKRVGFQEEGIRRKAMFRDWEHWDTLVLSLLNTDTILQEGEYDFGRGEE